MNLDNFNKIVQETPEDINIYVDHTANILERIHELLKLKFNGKQKPLAEKMGKTEAEVSKLLSGYQNYTLKTISKLEAAFGDRIICIATNENSYSTFEQTRPAFNQNCKTLWLNENGIEEKEIDFKPSVKSHLCNVS